MMYEKALQMREADGPLILAIVEDAKGSTPRGRGTQMLISKSSTAGTIGGGNLEYKVIEQARKMLAEDVSSLLQNYPLGPLLEQCCGGQVMISLERMEEASLESLKEEPTKTPLYMFGAGHVGRAVARLLETLDYDLVWIDSRDGEFPEGAPKTVSDNPVSYVASAPEKSIFLIFTHSHQLDYELVSAVLARADYQYCGLIGSKTKRVRFEKRLRGEGRTDEDLDRLSCPIGLKGIRGKAPEIIAISVVAALVSSYPPDSQ